MSRKNNIITTSAIISLLLTGVSTVHAEPENIVYQEPQLTEVKVQDEVNNQDFFTKLRAALGSKQQTNLINELTEPNDVLLDAITYHENAEFKTASELYNTLLNDTELTEEVTAIITILEELSVNELVITNDLDIHDVEEPTVEEVEEDTETNPITEEDKKPEVKESKPSRAALAVTNAIAVNSETNVNYRGYLQNSTGTITRTPGGTRIHDIGKLSGKEVRVSKEAATKDGTWLEINVVGTSINGWVIKDNVDEEQVSGATDVTYRGYLKRSSDTINTRPWGTRGYRELRRVNNLQGREVEVLQEASTQRATWLYIKVRGTNVTGWIDKNGIDAERILSEKNSSYIGLLSRSSDTISTQPWGTKDYSVVQAVGNLRGTPVEVLKEAMTQRATWLYVKIQGTDIAGWIDKKGVSQELIITKDDINYRGRLSRRTDTISTLPWGTPGYKVIRTVGNFQNREIKVIKEAVTPRATWLYVEVLGTNVKGWVDKAGVTPESITSEKNVDYRGYLNRPNDTINTMPWGVPGFKEVSRTTNFQGKEVRILKEAVTQRATWLYIEIVGSNVKGWIDKNGVSPEAITSQKNVSYRGYLSRSTDTISTLPWGIPGYKSVQRVSGLLNREVSVMKEAITPRATWLFVEVVGTNVKGWIDKKGVSPEAISSQKNVNYRGYLSGSNDTINSMPWGMPGYELIRAVGNLQGKEVRVIEEATTQRATWLNVEVVGTSVTGWIDKTAIRPESIKSEKTVNYRAFLLRENDSINTLPWGMPGYKEVRKVNDLSNTEVHVTKEAVTDRATWVYVSVVGENISGWVDKKGIIQTSVAYRNTYYNLTFEEILAAQMRAGYPQTDAYGGGWKDAKKEDVARYLNPENFVNVNNGSTPKMEYVQITTGALNFRSAPSTTNSRVIGTVTRNQVYEILDGSNGWYKIDVNGVVGWISGEYVALISEIQYRPTDKVAIVNASSLNVRNKPSASGTRITSVKKGGKYKVIDEENGWYKLEINGTSGWASGSYLDLSIDINKDNLQFLSLSSPSGLSVKDLNEILEGKGILEGQGAAFIEASQKYKVNEIYLISHALLETGNGKSQLATGVNVKGTVVYNMYGIGAVDHNALVGGSQRAHKEGWDTPAKAIIGGAAFINNSYVNSAVHKQDTLYKMKWNPANPPTRYQRADGVWVNVAHQYATDIGWAVKQTRTLDLISDYTAKYNLVLKFDIPIYN